MSDKRKTVPGLDIPSLTKDEARALPAGTPVWILWSGGNGPYEYVIDVGWNDERYAVAPRDYGKPDDPMRWYNPLGDFIGPKHPFTRVWLKP